MGQRLVFLLRRLDSMSRADFQSYWRQTHAPLVAGVADVLGITRYQQVHTVRPVRDTAVAEFDGVAELWFDAARSTGSPEQQLDAAVRLLDDERRFIDLSASPIWLAEEVELTDGPHDPGAELRLTAALRRHPDLTRHEFATHWRDVHGPLALSNPDVFGFRRYVQLHTPDDAESFPPALARGAPAPFDGVSEIWRDPATASDERQAEVRATIMADEARFVDVEASPVWLGQVHTIIDR